MAANAADITESLASLNITDNDFESVFKFISQNLSIFEYVDFNRETIMQNCITRFMEDTDKDGVFDVGNIKYKKNNFVTDMCYLCAIFSAKGGNWNGIKRKSTKAVQKLMAFLRCRYAINTSKIKAEAKIDSNIVTLTRIAAIFPMFTVKAFLKGCRQELCSPKEYFPKTSNIPQAVFAPMIIHLLPIDKAKEVASVFLYISFVNDRILHSKGRQETKVEQIVDHFLRSLKLSLYKTETRIKYCVYFKLGELKDQIFFWDKQIHEAAIEAEEILSIQAPTMLQALSDKW